VQIQVEYFWAVTPCKRCDRIPTFQTFVGILPQCYTAPHARWTRFEAIKVIL